MEVNKEILKGHIDTMLLSTLKKESMYGYQIAKEIKKTCENRFEIKEGTMYLALKRLEKNKKIESYWNDEEITGGARRKYYKITETGEEELKRKKMEWEYIEKIIKKFLK